MKNMAFSLNSVVRRVQRLLFSAGVGLAIIVLMLTLRVQSLTVEFRYWYSAAGMFFVFVVVGEIARALFMFLHTEGESK